jgi:hypothetical protein
MTARFSEFMFGIPWLMESFHQDAYFDGPTPIDVVMYHFAEDIDPDLRKSAASGVESWAP